MGLSLLFTVDYGSWFDYTLDWEKMMADNPEYPIHTLSYESMKQVCVLLLLWSVVKVVLKPAIYY